MKITPEDLKTERHWRSATGMDKARFYKLLEGFKKSYRDKYSQTLKDRQVDNKQGYCINNEEELLLFTLLSLKSGLTYDLLGLMCGMDGSNAQRNQRLGLGLLQQTLNTTGDLPKGNFLNKQEFEAYFANTDTLIIDATEQQISRPSDKSAQRDHYSGKKKTHTLKSMIISSSDKFIKYISPCYQGNCHDYKLLKIEFPPEKNWFEKWIVKVDLGYLGIAKEYRCKQVFIPYKKTKLKPLTDTQKNINKQQASERIIVEHSIGGMKRYRILSDRLRIHLIDFYDNILAVCAGIWNFYLAN